MQKKNATTVITTTQELLGNASFQVLGLDITEGIAVVNVFGVLKQYKDSGNMTEVQSDSMRAVAEIWQAVYTKVPGLQGTDGSVGMFLVSCNKPHAGAALPRLETLQAPR